MMLKTQCSLPQPRGTFDDLFDRFFGGAPAAARRPDASSAAAPRTNILETADRYELAFELPGVAEADIQVQLHERTLTVTASRADARDEAAADDVRWHRVEHRYGELSRAVSLPQDAADAGVDAVYKNGVLTVTVPKEPEAQPAQITVRAE